MVHKHDEGNIGAWLDEQQAAIAQLSAKDIGFQMAPGWYEAFLRNLEENRDAGRLNRDILSKCRIPLLAGFIVLIVSTSVEDALIQTTKRRGRELKTGLRAAARNLAPAAKPAVRRILKRADRAFDARRKGLAEYCQGTLVVRQYLHAKSGLAPTARELAALLKAGLAASGRALFHGTIDHDRLRRNLQYYERKHAPLSGDRSIEIIETYVKPR